MMSRAYVMFNAVLVEELRVDAVLGLDRVSGRRFLLPSVLP